MLGMYNSVRLFLLRHKHKLLILSRLSDLMTCSDDLVFIVEIQYVSSSDHINTVFKHLHP